MRSIPAMIGYDPVLVRSLAPPAQRQIARVAEGLLLSALLLSTPVAYAAWLVAHSLVLSVAIGAALWLTFVNMLRLITAGGGAAAHFEERQVRAHRPALGASLFLGALAFVLAQPAQLPLYQDALQAEVVAHRATLARQHAEAVRDLPHTGHDAFRRRLAQCDFLVLRLHKVWEEPTRAAWWSIGYVLAVLFPALFARFFGLSALRAYELARFRQTRAWVRRASDASRVEVEALLSAYPTYAPRAAPYADPPFNTVVQSPLLSAPPKPRSRRRSGLFERWRGA